MPPSPSWRSTRKSSKVSPVRSGSQAVAAADGAPDLRVVDCSISGHLPGGDLHGSRKDCAPDNRLLPGCEQASLLQDSQVDLTRDLNARSMQKIIKKRWVFSIFSQRIREKR